MIFEGNMKSKHYNYLTGRFYQPDAVNGSIGSAMSWNLYSYVQGNPMNFVDPYGLRKKSEGGSRTSEYNEKKTPKEECDEMGCSYSEKGGIGYCDCGDVVYVYAKDTNYGIPQDMLTGYLWETGTIEDPNFTLFSGHEFKETSFEKQSIFYNLFYNIPSEYSQCRKEFFECLGDLMNPFTPSFANIGAEAIKGVNFYFSAKAYNYALKKGLIQPMKSSIYRTFVSKAKISGAGTVLFGITAPVGICLYGEISCLINQ